MSRSAVASVPGKLILMGEHAAVFGHPALVAAVSLRARVEVTAGSGDSVLLDLPDLGYRERVSWSGLLDYTSAVRERWRLSGASAGSAHHRPPGDESPENLVKVALGEAAEDLAAGPLPPLALRVDSEIPVGSGFGSSAAVAVGVVAALHEFLELPLDRSRVGRVVLEAERRQHGAPSGVDHSTVLQGGFTWARRSGEGGLELEPLEVPAEQLSRMRIFDTGAPAESTGGVVAGVGRNWRERSADLEAILIRMGEATREFRHELVSRSARALRVAALIRDYEECLERLGVVPSTIQGAIRQLEQEGAAAKISGAGALSGEAAGCLLAYWPAGAPEEVPPALEAYRPVSLRLGVEGLRLEGAG